MKKILEELGTSYAFMLICSGILVTLSLTIYQMCTL